MDAYSQEADGPSLAEFVDHQQVCASVIMQAVLDAGTFKRPLVIDALAFAQSDRFWMFCTLSGLSDESAQRIHGEILRRVRGSLQKIDDYRQRRRQLRAG